MQILASNFWLVLHLAIIIYWIGVAVFLISEDREPTKTLAWLLVLFALPFIGLALYFFFGRNWPRIVQSAPHTRSLRVTAVAKWRPDRARQEGSRLVNGAGSSRASAGIA